MAQLFNIRPQNQAPSVIPDDVPVYRVNEGKFYADNELFDQGSIIVWNEEPNQSLDPMNEMAKDRLIAYYKKLDEFGRSKSEKDGKAYVGLLDQFIAQHAPAKEDGRRSIRLTDRKETSMFGEQSKERKVEKIVLPPAEPEVKRPRGRPPVDHTQSEGGADVI